MAPLNSFICNIYVITSPSFVSENENITLKKTDGYFHKIYTHL